MRALSRLLSLLLLVSGLASAQGVPGALTPCKLDGSDCGQGVGTVTTTSTLAAGRVALSSGASSLTDDSGCSWTGTGPSFVGTFGGGLIVGTEAALFNTHKGANSVGLNMFIGGGGQSAVGAVGETYKGGSNTFLGIGSGMALTAGYANSLFGTYAGQGLTTGYSNVAIGSSSGQGLESGANNVFVGSLSGYSTVSGYNNSFLGSQSGQFSTGYNNLFLGARAGYSTSTGSQNTVVGTYAGYANSTGTGLVILGNSSGRYETGSNAFYLNNVDQADAAGDKAYSLLYGTFAGSAGTRTGNMLRVNGAFEVAPLALTAGTMTVENVGEVRTVTSSYTWSNAQIVALGAALTGDIKVATLPAKTQVIDVMLVITGQGAGTTTLTASCGRTAAGYVDYIVASDAKAAAGTVYGDASGERGTNLTGYDLPSYSGTTDIYCHFVSTVENLDQVTGSTGRVILTTRLLH